jgi:CHAT domain-containing protein/pimeloyl-ACP methyl ester carboxylesterase
MQIKLPGKESSTQSIPASLSDGSVRSGVNQVDNLPIKVEKVFELDSLGRSDQLQTQEAIQDDRILALETNDGNTIFIRVDELHKTLKRLHPEISDDELDISLLRDDEATSRGLVDWVWSKVSVLNLLPDELLDTARQKAQEWIKEKLHEEAGELVGAGASSIGAKALMWAIENTLAGDSGLYRWNKESITENDRVLFHDERLQQDVKEGPLLLFIHGTASNTEGSFNHIRKEKGDYAWGKITQPFGERIYGFEHRTFSESPLENALQLANTLPAGAELCLVTHSRGGLVGDLLCMGNMSDDQIKRFTRAAPNNKDKDETPETDKEKALREAILQEEQEQLRTLKRVLNEKNFNIKRYVRVACPAAGTALLSDNLDVFLSSTLSLMNTFIGTLTGPLGGSLLGMFRRIVLEIADKRIQPHMVPGIEAMLPESPLTTFLAQAQRKQGIDMAVVSGDIEGGHLLKRIAVMFTDWMFFDESKNDLVVDTNSMYAGLACSNPTRALYDKGSIVNHFCYFKNPQTRIAILSWLTESDPKKVNGFYPLQDEPQPALLSSDRSDTLARPIVVLLPGIMGSHLAIHENTDANNTGDRVWLDFLDLMNGGLKKIEMRQKNVHPDALLDMFYGDLAHELKSDFQVIAYPYDWRKPLQETAKDLAKKLDNLLTKQDQPIHLLAHSMGGLLARTVLNQDEALWDRLVDRGGYFTMLGTPNNGSHLMVENLFCKGDTARKLARLDLWHSPQEVVDFMAGFTGALQLLPRPGFIDTTNQVPLFDYFDAKNWKTFRNKNKDRWLGNKIGGTPTQTNLNKAKDLWEKVLDKPLKHTHHISYVYGKAESTACGLVLVNDSLKLAKTEDGDGSVSWKSGELSWLPKERYWYMQAEHSDLPKKKKHFGAIKELLQQGSTRQLPQEASRSRNAQHIMIRDAGPVILPTPENLLSTSNLPPLPPLNNPIPLKVSVRSADLRYAQHPLICGHYAGDSVVGSEAVIDNHLVNGALSKRERMGIYADKVGTHTIILSPTNAEEQRRGTNRGVIVVGLGQWGKLSNQQLMESVRDAVLAYLLDHQEASEKQADGTALSKGLKLNSLLLGYSANSNIIVESSVDYIVRGVCEANYKFSSGGKNSYISDLEFIEHYLDTAITAAHTVATLPERLHNDLKKLQVNIEAEPELLFGGKPRSRLSAYSRTSLWPQMSVTAAANADGVPPQHTDQINKAQTVITEQGTPATPLKSPITTHLKYIFLSDRARAENIYQQRQPGLIEALIKKAIRDSSYQSEFCHTLFELMVPLDFKPAARQTERLLLVVDAYTANLPWEMLQADDEPLALKMAMVRKLISARYRRVVNNAGQNTACIIGNPSSFGFYDHFPPAVLYDDEQLTEKNHLPSLKGAAKEAATVKRILQQANYEVEHRYPANPDEEPHHAPNLTALDVLNTLFKKSYRILMISAHGEVDIVNKDGQTRTGVILSDGIMLTAAEISQMEVVPELVFLNCCHVGHVKPLSTQYNRLAYSLANELIEMGVRCVIVAGWAVNDTAACVFAEHFFTNLVENNMPFGMAVWKARKETYAAAPGKNTWGAYQAYGDPDYVLEIDRDPSCNRPAWKPVAPHELIHTLNNIRLDILYGQTISLSALENKIKQKMEYVPPHWIERSDVQNALGQLYQAIGDNGIEAAIKAYQLALVYDDKDNTTPLEIVETLIELEIRQAKINNDLAQLDNAIERLKSLLTITQLQDGKVVNSKRHNLLGKALKYRAAMQVQADKPWSEFEQDLLEARRHYWIAEHSNKTAKLNLEACINRLQLDILLHQSDVAKPLKIDLQKNIELAQLCKTEAHRQFADSREFFDAIASADAEITVCLAEGKLVTPECEPELIKLYREASSDLSPTQDQVDVVVQRLQLLSDFMNARKQKKDSNRAQIISKAAQTLQKQFV